MIFQRPPPPMRSRPSRFSSAPFSSHSELSDSSLAPPPMVRAPNSSHLCSTDAAKQLPQSTDQKVENSTENDQDLTKSPPPTPKFDKIKESIYLCNKDLVRAGKETRKMECDCDLPEDPTEPACGEACLNRNVMIECSSRCKCQDRLGWTPLKT